MAPCTPSTSAAAAIRRGELTPVDLLDQCLARIDRLEDRVRAWVLVDRERARADAVRLTDELKRGTDRGPLHGIPIGVKDIFDVFDWPTAAGSKRWANSYARQDCPAVARLRQAGAVLDRQDGDGRVRRLRPAADAEPVERRPHPRRVEQRVGGGRRVRHVPRGPGHADGRVDHPAGVVLRRVRAQADLRRRQPGGRGPVRPVVRPRGDDRGERPRPGAPDSADPPDPRDAGRARPTTPPGSASRSGRRSDCPAASSTPRPSRRWRPRSAG